MVAPYANSQIEIEVITELNSKPYVDMTIAVMQDFGVELSGRAIILFSSLLPITNYHPLLTTLYSLLMPLNPMLLLPPTSLPRLPSAAVPSAWKIFPATPNRVTLPFWMSCSKWAVP